MTGVFGATAEIFEIAVFASLYLKDKIPKFYDRKLRDYHDVAEIQRLHSLSLDGAV